MLLTVSLLNKGTFLGSLINKCRPASVAHISLSSTAAATNRTLEQLAGMPLKPKKPMTPYFRFMKEQRPKLKAANPEMHLMDIVKQISEQWKSADSSLKHRLMEEFKKDQQQYVEKRIKYDAKITDEQRSQLKVLKNQQIESKEKRMMRKRIKDLGRPIKPASAFLKYIAKERLATPQTPKQTFPEWIKQTKAKWGTLKQEEKNVYLQEARMELDEYKKKLSTWEEEMIRQGNIDVVRQCNFIDPPHPKLKKL